MKDCQDMGIAIWMSIIARQHHDVGVGAWFDSVLISPIVICGKIDAKCFVGIDTVVQEKKLCAINGLDVKVIKKKSTN